MQTKLTLAGKTEWLSEREYTRFTVLCLLTHRPLESLALILSERKPK
jgi:hypothetical protein